jgi:hypothetical protein
MGVDLSLVLEDPVLEDRVDERRTGAVEAPSRATRLWFVAT